MKTLYIANVFDKVGATVDLCGWVHTKRDHKKVVFIDLRDRSGIVQVVGDERFAALNPEDVVCIKGTVKKRPEHMINPKVKTGEIEIEAHEFSVLSKAQTLPFDFSKERLDVTLPVLLDYRALTLRHPKVRDIFYVQAAIAEGFWRSAGKLGCIPAYTPTIAPASSEGGAEVFKIKYYDHDAFLVQSPQLYKQMLVPVFERVMMISKAYRAEPSVTTRHLSESTQMDCEFGFVEFSDLLDLLETVGRETISYAADKYPEILESFGVKKPLVDGEIPRLTLRAAQEIIYEKKGRDNRHEKDLAPEDERDLSEWAREEKGSDLLTITHFPTEKRAFYTKPDPKDPTYSLSYDLLFRGIEVLSGSQRIDNYDELSDVIKKKGMNPKDFEIYLQAFKYGIPPHGGFSFGLERLTMELLKLTNIREASLFPRDMERVDIHLPSVKKDD